MILKKQCITFFFETELQIVCEIRHKKTASRFLAGICFLCKEQIQSGKQARSYRMKDPLKSFYVSVSKLFGCAELPFLLHIH